MEKREFKFNIYPNRIIHFHCGKNSRWYAWIGDKKYGKMYGFISKRRLRGLYNFLKKMFEE